MPDAGKPSGLTLGDLAGAGMDEMDVQTDGLPRLRLQQPSGRGVTRPGTFEDMATLVCYTKIEDAAFLRLKQQRQYFSRDGLFAGEDPLRCWSDDGKVPSPDVKTPAAQTCTQCPKATWAKADGKNVQPCREVYASIIGVGQERKPYLLEFRGASGRAAVALYTMLHLNKLPIYGLEFDLFVEEQQSQDAKKYFVIKAGNQRVVGDEEAAHLHQLFEQYKSFPLKARGKATVD